MRARNIKPGFFKNELLGTAEPLLSMLFAGLWLLADRDGRLEDRPLRIKAEIFPYRENLDINGSLTELERMGFLHRYEVSGCAVIQILNFRKHQTPHKTEKASVLPAPPDKPLKNMTTSSTSVKPPDDGTTKPAALPPDSLIPDSQQGAREVKSFFQKCFDLATAHFPSLAAVNVSPIYAWEMAGYDFQRHVKPAMDSAKAKGVTPRSFNFFTGAIGDAANLKLSPAFKAVADSEGRSLTPEQHAENRKWFRNKGIQHKTYNPEGVRTKEVYT
jgi:hypothetical protein